MFILKICMTITWGMCTNATYGPTVDSLDKCKAEIEFYLKTNTEKPAIITCVEKTW